MSPSTITLLFLLFAVIMFVLEKIPLGVTSMIVCIGLVVTGVLDVKTAFAGFIDSNVILFVAMFIVGGALFETGMANKIGGIVTKFAKTERMLIIAIMVIVGLMSGILSNTGTAAVLIPVVIGIAAKSGYKRSRLLMPLVFAAAMGGNLSLIGAPGNLIAQSALGEIGLKFGFFEYAIVGMPILIVGIIFYATIGYKLLPSHDVKDDGAFDTTKNFDNVPKWKQWLSLIILVFTLLAMIFEDKIGIKLCISGGIGALLLILTGVISEKDALKSIDLKTIFLFGGTLSLASALQETGAGEVIANKVIGALGANPSPYILTLVVFLLCCYPDKLHVKYSNNSADGSNLSFNRTGNGSGSKSCIDGLCNRWFLRICDTNRNASKYNGGWSRRIQVYGLCKSRIPIDHHCNSCKYDYPSNRISILPVRRHVVGMRYKRNYKTMN
jgi:hypothetical protein